MVGGLLGQGFWILGLLLLGTLLLCGWILYRKLDVLRRRDSVTQGELSEALIRYRIGVQRLEEAAAMIQEGRALEAVEKLEELRKGLPGLHAVDFLLGKAYLDMGDYEAASRHITSFLEQARPYDKLSQERVAEARRMAERLSSKA